MLRFARPVRKSMIILVSLTCLLIAGSVFLLQIDRERLVNASTPELLTILGLLVLPVATLALIEMDRRANRR